MKEGKKMYFFDRNDEFKENIMCIDDQDVSYTYEEIWNMGDEYIMEIPTRSLVLLPCSNDVRSLSIYLALLRKKCPVILVGKLLDKSLLDGMIASYSPEFIIEEEVLRVNDHEELYDELGLLLSTSGSTGASKLVRLSYKNIQANCDSIVEYLGLDENEIPVTTLPMEYTYGLSVIHSHIAVGATILLTNLTLFNSELWDRIVKYKVTSIAGVPYSYEMMFRRLRINEMDLPSLKTLTQAGGHLQPDLQEFVGKWAENTERRFFVMYGQTEATARMSYLPPSKCLTKLGSIGIPIPGGRIEIEDEELIYYGENVSLGYALSRLDLSKGDDNKGRLVTGDMARKDEDGYFFITGRKKRFIKLFGKRISLDQVQEVLQEEVGNDEIVCTGKDDEGIIVWIEGGTEQDTEKIIAVFSEKWNIRQRLVTVKHIDKIPRNPSGKVVYKELV